MCRPAFTSTCTILAGLQWLAEMMGSAILGYAVCRGFLCDYLTKMGLRLRALQECTTLCYAAVNSQNSNTFITTAADLTVCQHCMNGTYASIIITHQPRELTFASQKQQLIL